MTDAHPAPTPAPTPSGPIGARLPMVDAHARVTGDMGYVLDLVLPGMSHARILRSPQLAEEVSQDVFLKVWKHAGVFEEQRGAFSSWVLTMTHHGSIDALRRAKARGSQVTNTLDNIVAATLPSPRGGVSTWQRVKLEEALETLPEKQRQVVELAYFEGHTREEMAEILGEPVGTVKTRLRDAIQKLAAVFRDPEEALADAPGFH